MSEQVIAEDPHCVGFHWGSGSFTLSEATALRARLARANAASCIAALHLAAQRGDAATRAATAHADAATRALGSASREALLTHASTCHGVAQLVAAVAAAERAGTELSAAPIVEREYMRLVRGAALAGGASVAWRSHGSCVLPSVGLVLDVPPGVDIEVECNGDEYRCRIGGSVQWTAHRSQAVGTISMACGAQPDVIPSFSIGGQRLHVDREDPAFVEAWIPSARFSSHGVTAAPREGLGAWVRALEDAARVVERVTPDTASMVGWIVRSFIPIVSPAEELACSMSDSSLPGAIMSTIDGPPVLAESIVHEFRHNLLHQLERAYPIFELDSPREARFYSPWRTDPRPLSGILHALFVFLDVCAIHAGVLEMGIGEARELADSSVRLAANVRRIRIALDVLRGNARLTPFGTGFVAGIAHACDSFEPAFAALPAGSIARAERDVRSHRDRWWTS